jgi:hypothetical protein
VLASALLLPLLLPAVWPIPPASDDERASPHLHPPLPQKRKNKISDKMKNISYDPRRNFLLPQIVKNLL